MATKIISTLIDDIDGGDADETVLFGIDGIDYEIDLNAANAVALRESLAKYLSPARKTSRRPRSAGRSKQQASDLSNVRGWAKRGTSSLVLAVACHTLENVDAVARVKHGANILVLEDPDKVSVVCQCVYPSGDQMQPIATHFDIVVHRKVAPFRDVVQDLRRHGRLGANIRVQPLIAVWYVGRDFKFMQPLVELLAVYLPQVLTVPCGPGLFALRRLRNQGLSIVETGFRAGRRHVQTRKT
jgi:hypothetical protein